jgi:hypothetical protein
MPHTYPPFPESLGPQNRLRIVIRSSIQESSFITRAHNTLFENRHAIKKPKQYLLPNNARPQRGSSTFALDGGLVLSHDV